MDGDGLARLPSWLRLLDRRWLYNTRCREVLNEGEGVFSSEGWVWKVCGVSVRECGCLLTASSVQERGLQSEIGRVWDEER